MSTTKDTIWSLVKDILWKELAEILPEIIREILKEIKLSKTHIKDRQHIVNSEEAKTRKTVTMKVHHLKVMRRVMKMQKKKRF
eukprot:11390071-Ditylum_brightwellii.AAC.1